MDLDTIAAELYGVDPDVFVAARSDWVSRAKAAKDRPAATAIAALKRPTRSAWLVNLLTRTQPRAIDRLDELAARMATAHRDADLARLRELGAERQRLIDELVRAAIAAGVEGGYAATEAVRLEVSNTIAAAVADPEALAELRSGRVIRARVYSGFGFMAPKESAGAAGSPPSEDAVPARADAAAGDPEDSDRTRLLRREAEAAVEAATDALIHARAALTVAESVQSEVGAQLDRASQEVADLRAELRAAEQAEGDARRRVTEAADDVHEAHAGVQQAQDALARAARALS